MITALGSNVVFLCPIWKITSRDGLTAAYCGHTRPAAGKNWNPLTPFLFNGVTYTPSASVNTRDVHKIGFSPNSSQINGVFDNIIKRSEVEGGRWKLAKVTYEYVNYLDLTLGSTGKIVGVVGQIEVKNPEYTMEFFSNAQLLHQLIGDMTSPTDRSNFPAGLLKTSYQSNRNVVSSADQRHLVVDGAAIADNYYTEGIVFWTTGNNAKYNGMEIKSNTGNTLELQLPMPEVITAGDHVTLLAGYDGTRDQMKSKFSDMIDFQGEPDLPGLRVPFSYPQ